MSTETGLEPVDIRKSAVEILRIEPTQFKGYDLVDVRVWVETDQGGETVLRPTRKGVTFKRAMLDQVIPALQRIADAEAG